MKKKETTCLYTFLIVLFTGMPFVVVNAQNWYKSKVIIVEGWAELEDFQNHAKETTSEVPTIPPLEDEEEEKAKLRRASQQVRSLTTHVLSGMVYGYSFFYTPQDKARTVKETFTLEPIGIITTSDKNLSVVNADVHNASLFVISRYNLNTAQVRRAESWNTSTVYPTSGTGIAMLEDSCVNAKLEALQDAIRDAVRRRLRTQLTNKPKEVRGTVRISKNPLFVRSGQSYTSKVTVDIMVRDTQRYDTF